MLHEDPCHWQQTQVNFRIMAGSGKTQTKTESHLEKTKQLSTNATRLGSDSSTPCGEWILRTMHRCKPNCGVFVQDMCLYGDCRSIEKLGL